MKLSDICNLVDGMEILKDGEFSFLGLAVSECDEKILSFIESEKYISSLSDNVTSIITNRQLGEKLKDKYGVIVADSPRIAYFTLHNKLASNKKYKREELDTIIGENCTISDSAIISPKNVRIGNNVIIEDYVIIRENTVIEDNAIIRAGAILGSEGFEFKRAEGTIMNVIHCGGVIIGQSVEIQYNTAVDKGIYTWDNTVIAKDSKIDNLVHVGHGAKIGQRCLIAAKAVIGGRTVIGNDSWVGIGAIISNGLIIGENSSISLGSVVTKSLNDQSRVSGNFAIDHNKFIEFIKSIR